MIIGLTKREAGVLQLLAVYKFLTRSQMLKLLNLKHRKQLQNELTRLRERTPAYIGSTERATEPGQGSLEQMHYLTKRGAELVTEELGMKEPKYPKHTQVTTNQDYHHRKGTIDIEIALNSVFPVDFADRYFDHTGQPKAGTLQAKTNVVWNKQGKTIKTDLIFGMGDRLYCVEYNNKKSTRDIVETTMQYAYAISLGNPAIQYGYKYDARVLWVIQKPSDMENAMKRLQAIQELEPFAEHFLFQTFEGLNPEKWVNMKGEPRTIEVT